jgi:hypothetical protein
MYFDVSEPHTCATIDKSALQAWERDGVLRISRVIPSDWMNALRNRVIGVLGAAPEDPLVWPDLPASPLKPLGRDKHCVALEVDAVKAALDSLLGAGWEYPQTAAARSADADSRTHVWHRSESGSFSKGRHPLRWFGRIAAYAGRVSAPSGRIRS